MSDHFIEIELPIVLRIEDDDNNKIVSVSIEGLTDKVKNNLVEQLNKEIYPAILSENMDKVSNVSTKNYSIN